MRAKYFVKPSPLNLMLNLAQSEGRKTTAQLALEVGVSQQTVSRWLLQLQKEGLAEKTPSGYRLTNEALKNISGLKAAAEKAERLIVIEGTAAKGLGDGAYYMSLAGYADQIKSKLGFTPYPGTLNLRINGKTDLENAQKLRAAKGTRIDGFTLGGRFLGGAKCFKAKINGKAQGAVIIPDRTHHDSTTLEIIAPSFLKKKLGLKDGATAKVLIGLDGIF